LIEIKKKYEPIIKSKSRYYVVTGGRGSGKSFAVNLLLAYLTFEPKQRILFTRYTMTSAHLSIIPEFNEKIELLNASDYFDVSKTEITNKTTFNQIIFRGIKTSSGVQTAALKSLQGITTWVLDEAEELIDEETFDKIDLSIRQKGVQNRVILILNPTTKEHWIYKRFFERNSINEGFNGTKGDTTYIHTTYLDNLSNLDKSFIDRIEEIKVTNPNKYKHVILGQWIEKAEGVIFTNWEFGRFDESLPYGYGMDFGFSIDPTTLYRVAIDESKKVVYIDEKYYDNKQLSTSQIKDIVLSRIKRRDDLIIADSAEGRLIYELSSHLNIAPCQKGADSVREGILALSDYKLILRENSTNLVKELNNYCWNDKKAGVPIDAYNHGIDAVRYIFKKLQSGKSFIDFL
jgi:phage terminase large subunit